MKEEAVLLAGPSPSAESDKIAKVLRFFGVPCRNLSVAEFQARLADAHPAFGKFRVLSPADAIGRLFADLQCHSERMRLWEERVHSAFVFAGVDAEVLQQLARSLADDDKVTTREIRSSDGEFVVSDHLRDFCGVMAGLRVCASGAPTDGGVVLDPAPQNWVQIISAGHGAAFLRLEYQRVPVFLSTSRNIVDLDAELVAGNFDVRNHFLPAVPIVLYMKWAFAETCWTAPETDACLIIDDPLLKPNYGFLNFQELLALMERHRFSTNIAFIPWNWRRSDPAVVRLFKDNPERYSLSIHGCDHTVAEFGSRDRERLCGKVKEAAARMSRHEANTGIRHDPVMVFPQGVFSEAAMGVLKHSNFTAAVNTEVLSSDPDRSSIRVSDVWDVAVMGYSSFPIFTRRYPSQGIENLAFDILLGKPCLIVIHHDFCQGRYMQLVDFVKRLNELKGPLSWRSLGEVVRRSCRQRQPSPGVVEVEMYGAELWVENRSEERTRFSIRRRESAPAAIKEIRADSRPVAWNSSEGYVRFETELAPRQSLVVRVEFHDLDQNMRSRDDVSYRVKTMLRRYLSELRDNYLMTNKARLRDLCSSQGRRMRLDEPLSLLETPRKD
jgi:hypothetical protein